MILLEGWVWILCMDANLYVVFRSSMSSMRIMYLILDIRHNWDFKPIHIACDFRNSWGLCKLCIWPYMWNLVHVKGSRSLWNPCFMDPNPNENPIHVHLITPNFTLSKWCKLRYTCVIWMPILIRHLHLGALWKHMALRVDF